MDPQRHAQGEAGSNKLLWGGVAVVVVIVLALGIALKRLQTQPQEPQVVALPALQAPPSLATPAVASAATQAVSSDAAVPSAPGATDPHVDTLKPRIVQLRASEPAVARAPQRVTSQPGPVEDNTRPNIKP